MLWAQAEDVVKSIQDNWIYAAIAIALLFALLVLLRIARSRKKEHPDLEKGLREDLAGYPRPPANPGPRRFSIDGIPARLRLIVVAPTGKQDEPIAPDDVPELLDDVLRRLGEFIRVDKPRIKIWPAQISVAGFAPTFHRLVEAPPAGGQASRWVKLAGPARTRTRPILLGLAVYADEPCKLSDVHVESTEWGELLRVDR